MMLKRFFDFSKNYWSQQKIISNVCLIQFSFPQLVSQHRASSDSSNINKNYDSSSNKSMNETMVKKQKRKTEKRLDVAIIGMPNAGKSQLLNAMCQSKVTAVSRKRHTTRQGILGIRSVGDTQLVFLDTPGYMKHDDAIAESGNTTNSILQRLTRQAKQGVADSDISLLVIDAAKAFTEPVRETIASLMFYSCLTHVQQQRQQLKQLNPTKNNDDKTTTSSLLFTTSVPLILVLNKVDLVKPKTKLLDLAYEICSMADTCWEKAEHFEIDDDEDNDDNQENEGKVIMTLDDDDDDPINNTLVKLEKDSEAATSTMVINAKDEKEPDQQQRRREFCPVFMVSALHDDGVEDIVHCLLTEAMPGDWVETDGTTSGTDMTPQEHANEILREKIYRTVHKEVPYHVYQQNRRFEYITIGQPPAAAETATTATDSNNSDNTKVLRIEQDFVVATKSHKRLLEGKNGTTLRRITVQAQRDLQELFNCYVSLALRVKVKRTNNAQSQQLSEDHDDDDE